MATTRWGELAAAPRSASSLLKDHLAVRAAGFVSADEAAGLVRAVFAARSSWNADFGGEQFSLGRAWYTHLEEDRSREYFAGAALSNAAVERALPGLAGRMVDAVATVTGETATVRPGWCGPGVHVFPAGEHVALHGGVVHFDTEGLSEHQLESRGAALTLVLMLQPPESGGGLTVWDVMYDGEDEVDEDELASAVSTTVGYEAGDLLLLDSYRLHQIRPFTGARDRVSMTAHAARATAGWEVWF